MPRLDADYKIFADESTKLSDLLNNSGELPPYYRKLVAEIMMLRLFSLLENAVLCVACKLLCGASYLDSSTPAPMFNSRSKSAALVAMSTVGRPRHRGLKWSTAAEIKENLRFCLGTTEHFMTVVDLHGTLIDEMRRIRNRIAHNNKPARQNFGVVVQRYYGATLNSDARYALVVRPTNSSVDEQLPSEVKDLPKTVM